jgi:hypothetical protein
VRTSSRTARRAHAPLRDALRTLRQLDLRRRIA